MSAQILYISSKLIELTFSLSVVVRSDVSILSEGDVMICVSPFGTITEYATSALLEK